MVTMSPIFELNNGQESVFAEHYDVTVKMAFNILDIKYHQFIISYTYTIFVVSEKIWQKAFGDQR